MPTETEQQIVEQLAEAEQKVKDASKALALAKKQWIDAESAVIATKVHRDNMIEKLRIHRNTTPRHELSLNDLEIERFRKAHPELCEWAKKRDSNNE